MFFVIQIYLYLFLRNDALKRYHGYFLSSTQTISILNLFNAFYFYAANFLPRCFYLLLLHCPISCYFSFHFCKLLLPHHLYQFSGSQHLLRQGFFILIFVFNKRLFHAFHQVCNNLMHTPESTASVLLDVENLNSTIVPFELVHVTTPV